MAKSKSAKSSKADAAGGGVTRVNPPSAGPVFGLYSHVSIVEAGARVAYIAGQVSVDATGQIVGSNDLAAQTPVVFGNLEGILGDLGAT